MNAFIEKIKTAFSNYKRSHRQSAIHRLIAEINDIYQLTERDGNLYLVVGSRAVKKFEDAITVDEAIRELEAARNAEISYAKLNATEE
jgi:hypothetical protein